MILLLHFVGEIRLNEKVTIVKVDATRPAVSFSVFDVSIYDVFLSLFLGFGLDVVDVVRLFPQRGEREKERERERERSLGQELFLPLSSPPFLLLLLLSRFHRDSPKIQWDSPPFGVGILVCRMAFEVTQAILTPLSEILAKNPLNVSSFPGHCYFQNFHQWDYSRILSRFQVLIYWFSSQFFRF